MAARRVENSSLSTPRPAFHGAKVQPAERVALHGHGTSSRPLKAMSSKQQVRQSQRG